MPTNAVLCYIRDRGRVLLQLKADGRFGGGFWNGPGGKIAEGESPEQAAVREVREETGLVVAGLRDHGTLVFYFGEAQEPQIIVRVFSTERFSGTLQANEEGRLEWLPEDALPFGRMWPDDRLWVPHLLAGRCFRGVFRLSDDHTRILEQELEVS